MSEEDLIQWAIEKRLEMLSDKEGLPRQEETIAEIERILDDGLKPGFQTKIETVLDGIRWGENDIYLESQTPRPMYLVQRIPEPWAVTQTATPGKKKQDGIVFPMKSKYNLRRNR